MSNKIKWYQVARGIISVLYGLLMALGLIYKNIYIMGGLMISALLAGAFFCGWLCPFGTLQEWLNKVGRFLKIPHIRVPDGWEKILRFTRYVLFALSMTGLGFVLFLSSPYRTFLGVLTANTGLITAASWSFFGLFVILSMFMDRPFCRYFCTEGARYGIASLARVFSIKRDKSKCVSCGNCDRACPAQIKVSGKKHVRSAQCINCFECIASCPVKKTLSYGWVFDKKSHHKESSNEEAS